MRIVGPAIRLACRYCIHAAADVMAQAPAMQETVRQAQTSPVYSAEPQVFQRT
ncbi:hypothetical protein [Lysobacter gummosus]|uniref:hypothetical protein n=1 Tax=Lysobacter gummosus TaxID=262324 RepID=UPI0036384E98